MYPPGAAEGASLASGRVLTKLIAAAHHEDLWLGQSAAMKSSTGIAVSVS